MTNLPDNIRAMYSDAYRLHETLCSVGTTDEEWMKLAETCANMSEKHRNDPFMIDLIIAIIDQLSRERSAGNGRT